ncbi:MAG: hypothetical protein AAGH15_26515, partial [Myxococcota bacterium]
SADGGRRVDGGAAPDLGAPDAGVPAGPADALDVLFVIDDSGSMEEEQASLADAIPRLVQALVTGRVLDAGTGAVLREFRPLSSLRMGVVTTDMGTGGSNLPTCFEARFGDDAVLSRRGAVGTSPGCGASYPSFFTFEAEAAGTDAERDAIAASLANDVSCVAQVGIGGCGFEQQLEAMLKAITPASSDLRFAEDTQGNGAGGANDGFLREEAALGIVLVTDEDDCSVRDPDLFNPASTRFPGDLNLRCFDHPDAVYDLDRFANGLLALKPAGRLAFTAIAGLPTDLAPDPGGTVDYARIAAAPSMQERVDRESSGRLVASCDNPGRGLAFPPRRIVGLARALDARGAEATVQSLCARSFSTAIADVALRLAATLEP